jgi:hypothetical protein
MLSSLLASPCVHVSEVDQARARTLYKSKFESLFPVLGNDLGNAVENVGIPFICKARESLGGLECAGFCKSLKVFGA